MIVDELISILNKIKEVEGTGVIPIELVIYPDMRNISKDVNIDEGYLNKNDIHLTKDYHFCNDDSINNNVGIDIRLGNRKIILGGRRYSDS
jgi:hypothetical protein